MDSDYLDSGRECNLETATEPLRANEPFVFPSCSNLSVKIARKIHQESGVEYKAIYKIYQNL